MSNATPIVCGTLGVTGGGVGIVDNIKKEEYEKIPMNIATMAIGGLTLWMTGKAYFQMYGDDDTYSSSTTTSIGGWSSDSDEIITTETREHTVKVYHGSYDNYNEINQNGFNNTRTPVYISTDIDAANDAIYNRYDYKFLSYEMKDIDSGIIESEIPKELWDNLISSGDIIERQGYQGFGGKLETVEYQFNKNAIEILNKYILK